MIYTGDVKGVGFWRTYHFWEDPGEKEVLFWNYLFLGVSYVGFQNVLSALVMSARVHENRSILARNYNDALISFYIYLG